MLNNISLAVKYYTNVGAKNIQAAAKFLHPDVHFIGPLAELHGKEAVVTATTHFTNALKGLTIREKCAVDDKVFLVYEPEFLGSIGKMAGFVLLTIKDGLITKLELIYDSRKLETKKDEIFQN